MAFLVDDSTNDLVRNLWPAHFKHPAEDPADYAACAFWQAVPCNEVELSEWLQIVPNTFSSDRSRPYTVTHVPDVEDGMEDGVELYELGVRFTGFLERFNLGTLGNWDGNAQGAVKAVQTIVLSGGGYDAQWTATLRALNRIAAVVTKMVKPGQEVKPLFNVEENGPVFMQRRVFVKANTESEFSIPSDVAHRGPELRAIQNAWHLQDKMLFGQLTRKGVVKHATGIVFSQGHFVDVTAYVEVVVGKNGIVRVHFRPEHVVLIGTEGQKKGRREPVSSFKIIKRAAPYTTVPSYYDEAMAQTQRLMTGGAQAHESDDEQYSTELGSQAREGHNAEDIVDDSSRAQGACEGEDMVE